MKAELSHIWVKEGSKITCLAILSDGSSQTTYLPEGRHDLEGCIDQEGRRFLRLRDREGSLKVVEERELVRQGKGFVRRVYRDSDQPAAPGQVRTSDEAETPAITPITAADRTLVKKWMRNSIPEFLPPQHLGRYRECGSVDSWTVDYSIERRAGEWIIRCKDPDGERDASFISDVATLVADTLDRGYDPEDLLDDLRRSRHPHLITLAHEVEEVAAAKGWLRAGEPELSASELAPTPPSPPAGTEAARQTYVDDGGIRYYRHTPEPVRAFEVVLNVSDRASNLIVGTPDGIHEIDLEVRAHRQGEMHPVLRVHGQPEANGRLQLVVTNLMTGELQVIGMQPAEEAFSPDEMAKTVEELKAEGRMPTFEKVAQAIELVRDEWKREVQQLRGLPVAPKPTVH